MSRNRFSNTLSTLMIIGASRGLGLALTKEFLARNWSIIGTVRQESGTALHDLAQNSSDQLQAGLERKWAAPTLATQLKKPSRVVDTIVVQAGKVGLQYLDQFGKVVRW